MSNIVNVYGATGALGSSIAERLATRNSYHVFGSYRKAHSIVRTIANVNWCQINDLPASPYAIVWAVGANHSAMSWKDNGDNISRTLETNFADFALACRRMIPGMRENGKGRIIALSSVVAHAGAPGASAYAASKGALEAYVKTLALELAPKKITVNCVASGYINAGMIRDIPEEQREKISARIPLGFGSPRHVSSAVEWLLSDDAEYVTGQVINVNGGLL